MPKIAAIVLSYNNARDSLNCVQSIQNSSYPEIDIFVIDNHSPDGSFQALEKELFTAAHVFLADTGANLGYAGGMNFGFKKAREQGRYDYCLFLNNDTVLDPECLSELVKTAGSLGDGNLYAPIAYFSKTHIVFCGGMHSYIPGLLQFSYFGWPFIPHKHPYISPYLSGACFLVRPGLFEGVGGLDEALYLYGEDVLFGEKVHRLGGRVYMVPAARFWHIGSKAAGYVTITKAYYLSRNIPHLVKVLSNNNLFYVLRTYFYLFTKTILALVNFNLRTVRAIFKGLRDYRKGVMGPLVGEQETSSEIRNTGPG